jgi:hypothetical protein
LAPAPDNRKLAIRYAAGSDLERILVIDDQANSVADLVIGDHENAIADAGKASSAGKEALAGAARAQMGAGLPLNRSDEGGFERNASAVPEKAVPAGSAGPNSAVRSSRDDLEAAHRYFAACSDLRVGCGAGPDTGEAERAKLRRRALDSLKADLALRRRQVDSGTAEARASVHQILEFWKGDPDLAGIRQPEALARLPRAEQAEWKAFWAEAEALEQKIGDGAR